jgi:antitoxin (DNA-binding transcriptional repressor) of toxin-antitoxin stability system
MKRLDLDDVPPKIAALLSGLEPGEELLLVQNGAVVGRLTGAAKPEAPAEPDTDVDPEARAKEVFELFRASIEDEF